MSWTDADAPIEEKRALRLAMALKTGLGSRWFGRWWPEDEAGKARMERAWVAVARCRPSSAKYLYTAFRLDLDGHEPPFPRWGRLGAHVQDTWERWVLRAAKE
jgi:hypothetical protein